MDLSIVAATREALKFALREISKQYDHPQDPYRKLTYHGSSHTKRVAHDTRTALARLQQFAPGLVSDHDVRLAFIAAAFHDSFMEMFDNLRGYDIRPRGKNSEFLSTVTADQWMILQHEHVVRPLFTHYDMLAVEEEIMATVVEFIDGKVVHCNLNPTSSFAARILARVDVSNAGIHGKQGWREDTINLWRENDLAALTAHLSGQMADPAEMEIICQRILNSILSSKQFVIGQTELLETELLDWLPFAAREPMRQFFSRHTASVLRYADSWHERCAALPPAKLLEVFGYPGY